VLGLARNVRSELGSDWCVGESGTAGPTGGHQPNRTPYDKLDSGLTLEGLLCWRWLDLVLKLVRLLRPGRGMIGVRIWLNLLDLHWNIFLSRWKQINRDSVYVQFNYLGYSSLTPCHRIYLCTSVQF